MIAMKVGMLGVLCHTNLKQVYNFWEPLHFLHRGYGFQTWEVSPEYSIRSWAYVLLHLPIAVLGFFLSAGSKVSRVSLCL